jgi:hypothetical protein
MVDIIKINQVPISVPYGNSHKNIYKSKIPHSNFHILKVF